MVTLESVQSKFEEIRNQDFRVEKFDYNNKNIKYCRLLRIALLCFNSIFDIDNISKEDKRKLCDELDQIMMDKFQALNPNFSDETLRNMVSSYHRGYVKYPIDILVVEDAVFQKEGTFDDFGFMHDIHTFMFEGIKPYYNAFSIYFSYVIEDEYLMDDPKEMLSKDEERFTTKFVSDQINFIFGKNIVRPSFELDSDRALGYCDLTNGNVLGFEVYINAKHEDIARSIKDKEECDYKFCVLKGESITLFTVHQSFEDDKPLWTVVHVNNDVWRLTTAAMKRRKQDRPKVMKKEYENPTNSSI
jgi:hypothetical protein